MNAVSHIAVYWRSSCSTPAVDVCTLAVFVAGWRTHTLEVASANAGGHCTLAVALGVWHHGGHALYAGIMHWQSHCRIRVDC